MTTEAVGSAVPEWTVGDRIRKARQRKGWTQEVLAEHLDLKKSTLAAWELGTSSPAHAKLVLRALAVECGVDPEWLITGSTGPSGGPGGVSFNSDRYSSLRGVSVLTPRTHRTLVAA